MAHDSEIMKLEDDDLCRGMVLISKHRLFEELTLTPWERTFVKETPEWWTRAGGLTWKQRRVARIILSKTKRELERRKDLGRWAKLYEAIPKPSPQTLSQVKGIC